MSQSLNFWLKKPDLKALSHLYRQAWRAGLSTTYYLRTLAASGIEKAMVGVKKEVRGVVGEAALAPAATNGHALGAPEADYSSELAPNQGRLDVGGADATQKRVYAAEEKLACSIEAMRNGEECQACQ